VAAPQPLRHVCCVSPEPVHPPAVRLSTAERFILAANPSIGAVFQGLRDRGDMAFMPFITAGDPDLDFTGELILELARRGVDLVEVGFPYSDPIADGPVIQASYTRALARKLHVDEIFAKIGSLEWSTVPGGQRPPLLAMVAYAIVFRMGTDLFCSKGAQAGFSGLIIPDLPADEAADTAAIARSHGLDLVQLIAPTTTAARTERIIETASGFLYCISVAGTTGVREALPEELSAQLRSLKARTQLPLAVGFGISRPDQVPPLRGLADGVIVGSALVREVAKRTEAGASAEAVLNSVGQAATAMLQACRAK